MVVTRWRPLDDYHPAVRLMVRYMWRQEPPLLPSGFADQIGLPRQLVSRWLQIQAPVTGIESTDVIPAPLPSLTPLLATRLARAMAVAPLDFFVATGMCTYEEPLFAVEDAWEYVLAHVSPGVAAVDAEGVDHTEDAADSVDSPDALASVRRALEEARTADLARVIHPLPSAPAVHGTKTIESLSSETESTDGEQAVGQPR